ncbi:MAG: hemolysin family protein [Planctomycetota bacterium]|nr:hemolysin family protein [Planctomycetota bacterium]
MSEISIGHLAAALLLLLANALFVTAEFALVGLRRTKIEELIQAGRRGAERVKQILGELDSYLSTCQVGITLASLGLGWISEDTFARIFQVILGWLGLEGGVATVSAHSLAVGVAFLVVTFLHVVIGEMIPKTLALQFPETLALYIGWPMAFFHRLFWPLTWMLNTASLRMIRLMGLKPPPAHTRVHSEEELSMILDESRAAGVLNNEEHAMLERVFRFHDKTVREIMVPRPDVVALELHATQDEVIETAFKSGYSRLPVYDDELDNIVGIVYVKDLIYSLHHPKLIKLPDLLRPVLEFPETSNLGKVLREFQRRRIHLGIVVDEFGATTGLVTLEDIVEEIVGEIQDETDQEPAEVEELSGGVYLVEGKASVSRIEELFPDIEFPEGDFDTVGGLILQLAGKVPREGDSFRIGQAILRVVKREGRRIKKLSIRRVPPGKTQHFKPLTEAAVEAAETARAKSPPPLPAVGAGAADDDGSAIDPADYRDPAAEGAEEEHVERTGQA